MHIRFGNDIASAEKALRRIIEKFPKNGGGHPGGLTTGDISRRTESKENEGNGRCSILHRPKLATGGKTCHSLDMVSTDVSKLALSLPAEDRLDLARQLVESVLAPESLDSAILEGFRRIEDVAAARIAGLTEQEFRAALQ